MLRSIYEGYSTTYIRYSTLHRKSAFLRWINLKNIIISIYLCVCVFIYVFLSNTEHTSTSTHTQTHTQTCVHVQAAKGDHVKALDLLAKDATLQPCVCVRARTRARAGWAKKQWGAGCSPPSAPAPVSMPSYASRHRQAPASTDERTP